MTAQPPILPVEGAFGSPDSPPSADSGQETEDTMMIQDTPVIDATKLGDAGADAR